jgi:hypothetical protein
MNPKDKAMFFSAIGVKSNATQDEIKSAMKIYCKKNHPDINPNPPANFPVIVNLYHEFKTGGVKRSSYYYDEPTPATHTPYKATAQKQKSGPRSNWTDSQWDAWFDEEFCERAQEHGVEFARSMHKFETTQPRKGFRRLKKATFGALAGGTLSFGLAELVNMSGTELIAAANEIVLALRMMGLVGLTATMVLPLIMVFVDSSEYAKFTKKENERIMK